MNETITNKIKLCPSFESIEFQEFAQIVQRRLKETGLIEYLDDKKSSCIENASEFFVELVLQDGSLIQNGEGIILELADSFKQKHKHIRITGAVRAHWTVSNIAHVGHCRNESGDPKLSECFQVQLESGKARQIVEVEVTPSAFEEIERKLGNGDHFVQQVIRKLVEHDLKKGGLSYWHPIRYPKQYLNDIAAQAMIYEIKNPE